MKRKYSPYILILLFLVTNLLLLFFNRIDVKMFVLSTVASGYFSRYVEVFEYKNLKNYIYPVFMLVFYIIFASGSYQ